MQSFCNGMLSRREAEKNMITGRDKEEFREQQKGKVTTDL